MNYSEVKELLAAGFTANEIREMLVNSQGENTQFPQVFNNDTPSIEQEPEQPANDPDPAAEADNTNDIISGKIDSLNSTVEKLLKAVQAENRKRSTVNTPVLEDINKQVDDIMSSIIRPEHKKGD